MTKRSDAKPLSTATIKRRINKGVKEVQEVAKEFRRLQEQIPLPTPKEFARMRSGDMPLSYEAHLAGLLYLIRFHVLEVGVIINHQGRETRKSLAASDCPDQFIIRGLGYLVEIGPSSGDEEEEDEAFQYWDDD